MSHPNPTDPLSPVEQLAYAERHKILGFPIEQGYGALPLKEQAELYCRTIDAEEGRVAGNELRRKAGLPVAEDIAAANAKAEQLRAGKEEAAYAALDERPALEDKIAALEAELAAKTTVH